MKLPLVSRRMATISGLAILSVCCSSCSFENPLVSTLIRVDQGELPDADFDAFKATQLKLVRSPYIISAALRDKEIQSCHWFRSRAQPGGGGKIIEWINENLEVSFVDESEILELTFSAIPQADAKQLLDAIVDAYLEETRVPRALAKFHIVQRAEAEETRRQ